MEPQALQLADLRGQLIRQEETIIFALIERAQFGCNPAVYSTDKVLGMMPDGFNGSFLDFMFRETERLHALVRRYTAPDEMAFFPVGLPDPMLDSMDSPLLIVPNAININRKIKAIYETQILPGTAPPGDDKNYGSAAVCDIAALQALSKRIHFGKFIAEAKFQVLFSGHCYFAIYYFRLSPIYFGGWRATPSYWRALSATHARGVFFLPFFLAPLRASGDPTICSLTILLLDRTGEPREVLCADPGARLGRADGRADQAGGGRGRACSGSTQGLHVRARPAEDGLQIVQS
eukprot:m.314985 g.314985  ORF g.314985 m.314985 type:complete len:291 (-) comp27513_c0_seq1:2172-3044(-)